MTDFVEALVRDIRADALVVRRTTYFCMDCGLEIDGPPLWVAAQVERHYEGRCDG